MSVRRFMGISGASAAAMAIAALGAPALPPRPAPRDRPLAPLLKGYDPLVIRSQPHSRTPGQCKPHRRYYICPCGARSRLSWKFAAHRCSPAFNPWD